VLLRLNAFLALIIAAIVVSLLAPGEPAVKIARVRRASPHRRHRRDRHRAGRDHGRAMMDSGGGSIVMRSSPCGEKRGATASAPRATYCHSGLFDTVFYLLVPLARSMYGRSNRNYLKYLLAIAAGAGRRTRWSAHPRALAIAGTLGVDLEPWSGRIVVALPAAAAGCCSRMGRPSHARSARAAAGSALGAGAVEAAAPQPLPASFRHSCRSSCRAPHFVAHGVVSMTARPGSHVALWSAWRVHCDHREPQPGAARGRGDRHVGVRAAAQGQPSDLAEMVETSLMSAG